MANIMGEDSGHVCANPEEFAGDSLGNKQLHWLSKLPDLPDLRPSKMIKNRGEEL